MNIDPKLLFDTLITMVIPVIAGYVATKAKILSEDFSKKLSTLVLYVCQPFLLASSVLGVEYSKANVKNGLTVLLVGFTVHIIAALIAFGGTSFYKDKKKGRITEHCMIFANCGFLGIPVAKAVYGDIGVFYAAFFIITFNLVMWSYGVFVISRANKEMKINPLKILFNAGTVPCSIGLILYFTQIPIYEPVAQGMKNIGSTCTPLSMILVGIMLARIPIKNMFTNISTYYTSLIKLAVIPVVCAIVLKLIGIPEMFSIFGALMMSLPSASSSAMFAQNYDIYPEYAAQNVGISTVFSVGTIPLIMMLIQAII